MRKSILLIVSAKINMQRAVFPRPAGVCDGRPRGGGGGGSGGGGSGAGRRHAGCVHLQRCVRCVLPPQKTLNMAPRQNSGRVAKRA